MTRLTRALANIDAGRHTDEDVRVVREAVGRVDDRLDTYRCATDFSDTWKFAQQVIHALDPEEESYDDR